MALTWPTVCFAFHCIWLPPGTVTYAAIGFDLMPWVLAPFLILLQFYFFQDLKRLWLGCSCGFVWPKCLINWKRACSVLCSARDAFKARPHTKSFVCFVFFATILWSFFSFDGILYPFSYAAHYVSLTRRGQRADTHNRAPLTVSDLLLACNCNWLHALPLRKLPNNARIRQIWRRLWTSTFAGCRPPSSSPCPYTMLSYTQSLSCWLKWN